jgi:hypothetical protein
MKTPLADWIVTAGVRRVVGKVAHTGVSSLGVAQLPYRKMGIQRHNAD